MVRMIYRAEGQRVAGPRARAGHALEHRAQRGDGPSRPPEPPGFVGWMFAGLTARTAGVLPVVLATGWG
jgi:hypothetical protein